SYYEEDALISLRTSPARRPGSVKSLHPSKPVARDHVPGADRGSDGAGSQERSAPPDGPAAHPGRNGYLCQKPHGHFPGAEYSAPWDRGIAGDRYPPQAKRTAPSRP